MYLRKSKNSSGRIYLSIVKAYRDDTGKSRQKNVKKIGYLDELQKSYDDPIAHFTQVAKDMTKEDQPETFIIDVNERWNDDYSEKYIGYFPFTRIFNEMGIYSLIATISKDQSLIDCLEFFVFSSILMAHLKTSTSEKRRDLFGIRYQQLTLNSLYDALNCISQDKDEIKALYNMSHCYFDGQAKNKTFIAKINSASKITSSRLKARPAFIYQKAQIQSQLLMFSLALFSVRVLLAKLGERYDADEVIEALQRFRCIRLTDHYYRVSHKDPPIDEIGKAFGLNIHFVNIMINDLEKFLRS